MQISDPDALLLQELGQVFSHPLGKCCHQNTLVLFGCLIYLAYQVIYLAFGRTDLDQRVEKAGRPYKLLCRNAAGTVQLILCRCCGDIHCLSGQFAELFEFKRSVVESGRKSESVFYQRLLSRMVTVVHRPQLRQHRMRLVYDRQEIPVREVVEQCVRPLSRFQEVDVPGIVLDALACAYFHHHLDVVIGPLLKSLCLQQLAVGAEPVEPLLEFLSDRSYCELHVLPAGDIVAGRED